MAHASMTPCCQTNGCYACLEARWFDLRKILTDLPDDTPDEVIEELKPLYGACPFCVKSQLEVNQIITNTQLQDMIRWFER